MAWDHQAKELATLWVREADACQDADEAEGSTSYYLDQLMKDGKEIEVLKKEGDELLQKDNEASEQALEILSTIEKDKERKLAAETKLTATEVQACQDAAMLEGIRKEWDELC